jgi:3-oxoacyl-[acyl-carrier-protein] synthase-3
MKYNNVTIKGTSSYLPDNVLTNEKISLRVDTTDEWIFNKLGIKERRISSAHDTVSEMGYKAAALVLDDSGMSKEDIDMIIVATSSPEKISPSTACTIHKKLGITRDIPSFDINAVCSGFVYAITLGSSLISSGAFKNIMVIATESYSTHTDFGDQHSVFFGDGAGAVIIGESEKGWIYSKIKSNGSGTGMTGFVMPLDSPFIMRGKEVWDQAIKVLPESINEVLEETDLSIDDISMVVPHQPSINILKIIAEKNNIPFSKVKTVMDRYANIAGASIPVALDESIKNGEIKKGEKILLTAIGSGWTWGSLIVNYE